MADLRHGFGKFKDKEGKIYEGEWREGVKSGRGKIDVGDGMMRKGTWVKGTMRKVGKLVSEKGRREAVDRKLDIAGRF